MIEGNKMTSEENVPFAAEIFVSNLERNLKYYVDVLGFKIHRLDKKGKFASLKFNNCIFMIQEKDNLEKLKRVGVVIRFIIDDVENYYKEIKRKGAIIYEPIKSTIYGLTRFKVKDPEGFIIKFAQVEN